MQKKRRKYCPMNDYSGKYVGAKLSKCAYCPLYFICYPSSEERREKKEDS